MDGHSSHYCPQTIHLAAEEQVILYTLLPNTTHITAPLDKGCFGPFKTAWKACVHDYMMKNPGKVVTRYSFSPLFNEAWMKSMNVKNILSGFRVSGIYPLNRNAVKFPKKPETSLTSAASSIKYIPLLTPSKRSRHQPQPSLYEDASDSSEEEETDRVEMPKFESITITPDNAVKPAIRKNALSLRIPSPLYKEKTHQPKQSNRVLTSLENMRAMEEKQRKKEEEAKKKEEKRLQREKKKSQKKNPKKRTGTKYGAHFSASEIELFERRLENGYDLTTDSRYNQWLEQCDGSDNCKLCNERTY